MSNIHSIWIIGPGPVGLYLAAKLSQQYSVSLITKPHSKISLPIQVRGAESLDSLKLTTCDFTNIHPLEKPDLILLAIKAHDIRACLKQISSYSCPAVILSNGINLETEYATGKQPPVRAYCYFGVRTGSTKEIILAGKPRIEIEPQHAVTDILRSLFEKLGIATTITRDKKSAEWNKVLVNVVVNSIATLQRSENGVVLEGSGRTIAENLYDEVAQVAKAEGTAIASKQDFFERIKPFATNRNSLLLDIEGGRKTEIDFIQARFVEIAKQHRIEVPTAESLLHQLRNLELEFIETKPR